MAHLDAVMRATFNAAYSYFASINFSYGCTPHNWEYIYKKLKANQMDFIPSGNHRKSLEFLDVGNGKIT